jgi:hypothetical protein
MLMACPPELLAEELVWLVDVPALPAGVELWAPMLPDAPGAAVPLEAAPVDVFGVWLPMLPWLLAAPGA